MLKKSKVKNVQSNGTFESKFDNQTYYKYEITMENGDCGDYNTTTATQNKFVIDQDIEYTFDTSNPKYPKIKPSYQYGSITKAVRPMNKKNEHLIIKQVALKCSVDLCIAEKIELHEIQKTMNELANYVTSDNDTYKVERTDLPF